MKTHKKWIPVTYNKITICFINPELVKQQNINEETLNLIKQAHIAKYLLYDEIEKTENREELYNIGLKLTANDFELQKLWGYSNFHRWWNTPKCICPKTDNEEKYGTEYRIINLNCPIHYKEIKKLSFIQKIKNLFKSWTNQK